MFTAQTHLETATVKRGSAWFVQAGQDMPSVDVGGSLCDIAGKSVSFVVQDAEEKPFHDERRSGGASRASVRLEEEDARCCALPGEGVGWCVEVGRWLAHAAASIRPATVRTGLAA